MCVRVEENNKLSDSFVLNFVDVVHVLNPSLFNQIRITHGREFSLFAILF